MTIQPLVHGTQGGAAPAPLRSSRLQDDDPYRDEFGLVAPLPASHGQRRSPGEGFSTGPEIGERLPDFTLRAASGRTVDFHADRGNAKAAVVFYRSAVW